MENNTLTHYSIEQLQAQLEHSQIQTERIRNEIILLKTYQKNEELKEFSDDFENFFTTVRSLKDQIERLKSKWEILVDGHETQEIEDSTLFFGKMYDSTLLYFYALGLNIQKFQ